MSIPALSGKVFLLITGASQGIGKQIAIKFVSLLEKGSHVLLLARNLKALQETAAKLPCNVAIECNSIDLGTATKNDLQSIIMSSLKGTDPKEFDRVIVVHNVGSVGDVSKLTKDMTDIDIWRKYYDLNLFIPIILNGVIMEIFNDQTNTKKLIINITSLFAIQPQIASGYYSTVKAAKEMFFKVFALENPEIDVLNYSPGPVDTDMLQYVCKEIANEDLKKQLTEMTINKTVLTTEQTVNRLVEVLKTHKYKSADHVDYFDEL